MQAKLAKRILTLAPSPTVAIDTKAKALKQQGIPILNMGIGEPDFDTPLHIKQAAIAAIEHDSIKYAAPQGMIELRKVIADKFHKDNNISYEPSQIIVGAGSKQLLYSAFQVLCDKGDEVIIPVPTWSTFIEQVKLAEGTPVLLPLKPPFKLTAKDLEKQLTKKTKIILLNSPSNPTGAMIDKEELEKIGKLAVDHKLWIISDEIYENILYTNKHYSIASFNDQLKEQTITMNGVSKSYAMTGWRLGYAGGPQHVIDAMTSLQSQTIGNVPTFIQQAAITALSADQASVRAMHSEFANRRAFLIKAFSTIEQLSFTEPEGAFYLFVSVEKLLGKQYPTATAWCEALLEKEGIAIVPGEAFVYPGYFRLSFAASMEDLQKAVEKITDFIQ